jgi:hypothetical protein
MNKWEQRMCTTFVTNAFSHKEKSQTLLLDLVWSQPTPSMKSLQINLKKKLVCLVYQVNNGTLLYKN